MAVIHINGYIGQPDFFMQMDENSEYCTAKMVEDKLAEFKDERSITVRIRSFGGNVYEGKAIYSLLKNSGKVITTETIQAFSIASYIAQAASDGRRCIAEGGEMMIHPPRIPEGGAGGTASELKELAENLEEIETELLNFYLGLPNVNADLIREYFADEKMLSPEKSIEAGLADKKINKVAIAKYVELKAVANYKKPNTMTETLTRAEAKGWFEDLKAFFNTKFKNEAAPKPFEKETDKGKVFHATETITGGDALFTDEAMQNAAADGEYITGTLKITVASGKVASVVDTQVQTELDLLKAELQTIKAENEGLKTQLSEKETKITANEQAVAEFKTKLESLEAKFVGEGGNPDDKRKQKEPDPVPETISQRMKRLDAENRKKYNS